MTKFRIGGPATPEDLIDRKEEVEYLLSKMTAKSINYNMALVGYRRVGKTSILAKLEGLLRQRNDCTTVYFDVKKNMAEPKTFFTRLQKEIFDAHLKRLSGMSKFQKQMGRILGNMHDAIQKRNITSISVSLDAEGTIIPQINFGDKEPDYTEIFYSVFNTVNAFADNNNKFVVILDEFQDISNLKRYKGLKEIFDLFRSVIQERGDNVSYIISGSRVHMLNSILDDGKSSLFAHFEKMQVDEMEKRYAIELFSKYLEARGIRQEADAAEQAHGLVGGMPFYIMALADAWDGREDIEDTYRRILTSELGSLKNYVDYVLAENLSSVKGGPILQTILEALATSDGLSYSGISHKIDVAMTKLPFYMNSLARSDMIVRSDKKFIVRDPIVRDYLRYKAEEIRLGF